MLQKNPLHTLATENEETSDKAKAWHQKNVIQTIMERKLGMSDGGQRVGEERCVRNHGWTTTKRKTVGLHQIMCHADIQTLSTMAQDRSEPLVSNACCGGFRHQRAQAHGMKREMYLARWNVEFDYCDSVNISSV